MSLEYDFQYRKGSEITPRGVSTTTAYSAELRTIGGAFAA
jgi:hypothetical protein